MNRLLWVLSLALLPLSAVGHDDHEDREHEGREHEEHEGHRGRERLSSERMSGARLTPEWTLYQEECGACHLAYPPRMLPSQSWDALLNGLSDHFGQNAELDAETRRTLGEWLARWAAPSGAQRGTPLRITDTSWWIRKHDEIPNAVFARTSIGSRANCAGCHGTADEGNFNEHRVKIPNDAPPAR